MSPKVNARAIVLVAGMSSRIRDVTHGLPKSFLEVGGETLIARTLRLLRGAGVTDITLVTGYQSELFRDTFPGCEFVHNGDFKSTNTSVSLKLALNARASSSEDRTFIVNGDVYFAEGILEDMLGLAGAAAAVHRHDLSEEEVKVFAEGDRVTRIGKHLDEARAFGEAFGIYTLDAKLRRYLRQELNLMNNPKIFYEEAMDRLLQVGHEMLVHDVGPAIVQEIDFPRDYEDLKARIR